MKLGTLGVLSLFTVVVGIVPIAAAIPLGVSEIVQSGGLHVSEIAIGGTGVSQMASSEVSSLHSHGITSVQSIPVSASPFVLFGVGFIVLEIWHQRSRRGKAR